MSFIKIASAFLSSDQRKPLVRLWIVLDSSAVNSIRIFYISSCSIFLCRTKYVSYALPIREAAYTDGFWIGQGISRHFNESEIHYSSASFFLMQTKACDRIASCLLPITRQLAQQGPTDCDLASIALYADSFVKVHRIRYTIINRPWILIQF